MKIIVDADACPVKQIIEDIARKYELPVIMVANYHHQIVSAYATTIVADGAAEAADIIIANQTRRGDLVVTQDYGLAAIVLGKNAYAIHPRGHVYTAENIDGLLMQRHLNQKARQAKRRIAGPRKKTDQDDQRFTSQFEQLIIEHI